MREKIEIEKVVWRLLLARNSLTEYEMGAYLILCWVLGAEMGEGDELLPYGVNLPGTVVKEERCQIIKFNPRT